MDSLQISTGEKRIPVLRDGKNVGELVFNPSDTIFAEKFYKLIGEFENRLTDYQSQSIALEADNRTNGNDLPANMDARLELVKEACNYSRESIDKVFGTGTSQIVFGDTLSLDAVQQFFEGITPFIQAARTKKVIKYTNKKPSKKVLK